MNSRNPIEAPAHGRDSHGPCVPGCDASRRADGSLDFPVVEDITRLCTFCRLALECPICTPLARNAGEGAESAEEMAATEEQKDRALIDAALIILAERLQPHANAGEALVDTLDRLLAELARHRATVAKGRADSHNATKHEIPATAERIRATFKELDEAAHYLPLAHRGPAVERFEMAKHRLHVLLHEIASSAKVGSVTGQPKGDPTESVLAEADRLVNGDRQSAYGHPLDNFTTIGRYWSTHLKARYPGLPMHPELDAEDVAIMMALLKIARLDNDAAHRDSAVDTAGYIKTLRLVLDERKRRAAVAVFEVIH